MVVQLGQLQNNSVRIQNGRGLSAKRDQCGKSNTSCHEISSPRLLDIISWLLIQKVACGCASWRLGHFVFVTKQNAGFISKISFLTSWTKKSWHLENIYPFLPPPPPFFFPAIWITPPASYTISRLRNLHKSRRLVQKHTWLQTELCLWLAGFLSATCNCIIMGKHWM